MQFAVQHSDELQKFAVVPSLWYKFGWVVAAMIYLLLLALVVFIRRIQQVKFQRQLDDERRVAVLKARSLKNLVNPHFTLNALDAISGLISRSSTEHAKSYISKFARMIHSLMSRSDDLFVHLGQELEFVKDYLDLQQLRFENVFKYRIEMAEEVKQNRLIPKILIQTFAENAVRHGLRPKGKDGLLLIRINMEQKYLKVVVEDNGIGRKAALEQDTTHTGTGLKVIYQLIEILKYHADEPVRFHTYDLFDDNGRPTGTRVEVLLPEFRESVWEE
jgi:LytS/YehU family sensor histidine kinase